MPDAVSEAGPAALPTASGEPASGALLTASRDAPVGGQAVLEGVMMRGVAHWAVAVRKPAEGEATRPDRDRDRSSSTRGRRRRRVYRLPVVRGVVALVESLGDRDARARRSRANAQLGDEQAEEERSAVGRVWAGTVVVAIVFAIGLFFVVPVDADQPGQAPARVLVAVLARRGGAADRDLPRLPAAALADPRPAARVRVPRRGAQGDLVLRGRGRAVARAGHALLAPAPALRHELPADRDDRRDLRVRADRAAGVVGPGADADRRRAA